MPVNDQSGKNLSEANPGSFELDMTMGKNYCYFLDLRHKSTPKVEHSSNGY
jgi:hypothetical protein